jgi:6,7-dimethyl-8-ribityllumazine synthase
MAGTETHHALPLPAFDRPVRALIVVAPYYKDIADSLLAGARAAFEAVGATHETVEVPGALEIPVAVRLAQRHGDYDCFVALGCVIRGETTHYEIVSEQSSQGISLLGLEGVCIGNGILTVENRAQAVVRADPAGQNKGGGAAAAALHLLALSRRWTGARRGLGFQPGESRMAGGSGPA